MKTKETAIFDMAYYEGKSNGLRQAMVIVRYMSRYDEQASKLLAQLELEYVAAQACLDEAIREDTRVKRSA